MIDERILNNIGEWIGKDVEVTNISQYGIGTEYIVRRLVGLCDSYAVAAKPEGGFAVWSFCRPIEPQWIVPTDADALRRPECRVRERPAGDCERGKLIRVTESEYGNFAVEFHDGSVGNWRFCEILKPPVAV